MLSTRRVRLGAIGAGLLGLLALAWVGWLAWQVNSDLSASVRHAAAIQRAVEDGDEAAVERRLADLRESAEAASDRTSGPSWTVLTMVPVLGDDAEGIKVASEVIDDLATDGVQPIAAVAGRLEGLMPRDGGIDPSVVREIQGPVAAAHAAFAAAEARLDAQDPSGFVGRLDEQFTDFRNQVSRAARVMDAAAVATTVLPPMLGEDGPRGHLLVFQNNAEVRATGGLAGAVSYLRARDGRLALERHVAGSALGESPRPVLPLTDAETQLYGDVLGTYFVNAGMTPDVPRAAALMKARWEQRHPDQAVDGVLLVDAVAIAYLLDATGPVTVDGIELTADNVVEELLHNVYLRLEDPAAQDAFFAEVAGSAFASLTAGVGDPRALVAALARAADERRVHVHSFDEEVQAVLEGSAVAGDFVTSAAISEPQIAVTLNDTTGAKMSYFLRHEVDVRATSCVDGVQTFAAKARIRSAAPQDAAGLPDYITGGGEFGTAPGDQLVTLRVFGPVGGSIGDLEWNGSPLDLVRVEADGRPVGMTYVELTPGQTADLAWTMRGGSGQVGDAEVTVTPTIEKTDSASSLESACS